MKDIPNYLKKLAEVQLPVNSDGVIGGVQVSHDSWCAQLNHRGPCDCDPEIVFVEIQGT